MGNAKSKSKEKINKNHSTRKGFQFGVSFGKDSLSMEGHLQICWMGKTIKNYTRIPQIETKIIPTIETKIIPTIETKIIPTIEIDNN